MASPMYPHPKVYGVRVASMTAKLEIGKMLRIGLGANSPVLVPSTMY